ncbi:MAG: LolA family protein [Nannocystales bacterium]
MAGSLACILSYGLTCTPATVEIAEPPPPTPLEPAAEADPEPEPASDTGKPPKGEASRRLVQVQSFYDGTSNLQASFTQTYSNSVYGTKKVSKGVLKAVKPGKMVWDYAAADTPDIYVDGSRVWSVERDTKQVATRDIGKSDIAGVEKFLFGGKQLTEDFRVKIAEAKFQKRYASKAGQTAIRMQPKKKNPHYKEIILVVDDATGRVQAFALWNQDGSTNLFQLAKIVRNGGLTAKDVKFVKPAGYTLIEG